MVLLDLLLLPENELPRMVRLDWLNCSLKRKPAEVLYRASDRPPAKLDAAMNAIDLLAGRSLPMVTLLALAGMGVSLAVDGVRIDRKRLLVVAAMRDGMRGWWVW